MRTLALVLVLVFPAAVNADGSAGSVNVFIRGLDGVPEAWAGKRVAVRVGVGTHFLFQTPARKGTGASWRNRIRAYTARSNPLVFRVVDAGSRVKREARAPVPVKRKAEAGRRTSDEILATGMRDLVDDYGGAADPDVPVEEPAPAAVMAYDAGKRLDRQSTLCRATLEWPPTDGEHRLGCGSAVLVIETKWLGKDRDR